MSEALGGRQDYTKGLPARDVALAAQVTQLPECREIWSKLPFFTGHVGERIKINIGRGIVRVNNAIRLDYLPRVNDGSRGEVVTIPDVQRMLQSTVEHIVEDSHFFIAMPVEAFVRMMEMKDPAIMSGLSHRHRSVAHHMQSFAYKDYRKKAELNVFGYESNDVVRPVYGYASHFADGLLDFAEGHVASGKDLNTKMSDKYGRVVLKVSGTFAKQWGTITFGDSFGDSWSEDGIVVPSPIAQPHFSSFPEKLLASREFILGPNKQGAEPSAGTIFFHGAYIEAQFHCPVPLSAIETVRLRNAPEGEEDSSHLKILYAIKDYEEREGARFLAPVTFGGE